MKVLSEPESAPLPSRSFAVLDSHQRMLDRQAAREENQRMEREATELMLARKRRESIDDRVTRAVQKMKGRNVGAAIGLIESMSDYERDIYLIAEEIGENRKSVLAAFPAVRKSVRAAWEGEQAGPKESPAEEPDQAEAVADDDGMAQPEVVEMGLD